MFREEVKHFMLEMIMSYARAAFASMGEREEGQALVEYALILALVSVVAIATLQALGTGIVGQLQQVVTAL
jgi:Flp pilus assembly pilin Flp